MTLLPVVCHPPGWLEKENLLEEATLRRSKRAAPWFDLSIFVVFGVAAAVMAPISYLRGESGMAVFWLVQLVAMAIGFFRNCRRLRQELIRKHTGSQPDSSTCSSRSQGC